MATTKEQILNGINKYTPLLKENLKETFVTLQGGKDLSTNDFTDADKQKLDGIENNAQVNVIEGIAINGQQVNPNAFKIAEFSVSGGLNSVFISGGTATLNGGDLTLEITQQTDNNFSNADKQKLDGIDLSNYVSVEAGKGLSENNFSNADKQKLDGIDLSNYVSVEAGKGLSENNFSNADKQKLDGIDLSNYVSVEAGKGLSENDFTSAEKMKLNSVETNAQENVIETIYFDGVEVPVDSKTVSISASSGGGDFVINGNNAESFSIQGGLFSFDSSTKTANLIIASSAGKSDPNLTIDPQSLTFTNSTPQNVTINHSGDGIIEPVIFGTAPANITQIAPTEYQVKPIGAHNGDIFVKLSETADYYPAAKNINIIKNYNLLAELPLNGDFSDLKGNSWAKSGSGDSFVINGNRDVLQVAANSAVTLTPDFTIGGNQDFTIELQIMSTASSSAGTTVYARILNLSGNATVFYSGGLGIESYSNGVTISDYESFYNQEFYTFDWSYNATNKTFSGVINNQIVTVWNGTLAQFKPAIQFNSPSGSSFHNTNNLYKNLLIYNNALY